jgi:hypothetical protein
MSNVQSTATEAGFDRLFQYTQFHVGLYSGLIFGVAALIGLGNAAALRDLGVLVGLVAAVFFWVAAGLCGGVVLGNMVDAERDLPRFRASQIGFLGKPALWWETWEHRCFWCGVFLALVAFVSAAIIVSQSAAKQ